MSVTFVYIAERILLPFCVLLLIYNFKNPFQIVFKIPGSEPLCVSFEAEQKPKVHNVQPAPVKVYDYYNPGKTTNFILLVVYQLLNYVVIFN